MDLFSEIKKLNLPVDKYVVIGGASMAARGIKETADIDIVATPELFKFCEKNGWQNHPKPNGGAGLVKGIAELYLDCNCGNFNPTFKELRGRAQIINGIPFCSIEDVRAFKSEYKREKDFKDIALIDDYMRR